MPFCLSLRFFPSLAAAGLLMYEKQIFIVLDSAMYYLALSAPIIGSFAGDQTARGMIMASTCAAIFFTYAGAYGLYLNFLVPLYALMLVYLIATLFISYQYFSIIEKNQNKVWTYSFLLSLFMVELIWTMNFWPFGYLTTGIIALILYYVLWDLTQSYFLNLLSRKRYNMIFFCNHNWPQLKMDTCNLEFSILGSNKSQFQNDKKNIKKNSIYSCNYSHRRTGRHFGRPLCFSVSQFFKIFVALRFF
jgi:hypothetical protein